MMEQMAGSCPAPTQTSVKTWLPSSTRGAIIAPSYITSRFHGDGVRYKAKLIGMDTVPDVQGEKMCYESMMKLKGLEEAARKQGKHKQRVWLKISYGGLKIVDEKTGAVVHNHEKSKISYLTKDESDPRALAYIYQYTDACMLFYIKMAYLAAPVLIDIMEICQSADQETPQEPVETPKQNIPLLVINESLAAPAEELDPENVFSPRPETPPEPSNQTSSTNELMEVFAPPMKEPMAPTQMLGPLASPEVSQASEPESPQPMLSTSQILSIFQTQPVGGSPFASPQYSPTTMPWAQQGPLGNQWAQPYPGSMSAWAPPGVTAPPAGSQAQTHSVVTPQPRVMMGGNTAGCPTTPSPLHGHPVPVNSLHTPAGTTGAPQAVSPTSNKPSDGGFFDWDVLKMDVNV
ncbi:disabled homolog 1-like [Amphiprion ocellaris]|uniref:disabled homolog 1-like n=1 Tax=Amphiprion ocellaris TaxID=80972 RepID=UPI0024110BD8|nr:disabled homolog 1-like [Amphiprion ocellaris]XP_054861036.1 disabled homolog 1-like [Amphiprion ocellaris]